jgi:hypothetical protein
MMPDAAGLRAKSQLLLALLATLPACDGSLSGQAPTTLVGTGLGVADFPRFRAGGRLLVGQCCTFANSPDLDVVVLQGIESPGYEIRGSGFGLEVSFGPYTSPEVEQELYRALGERLIDGVRLKRYWLRSDPRPKYPAARHLWTGKVGGRLVGNTFHEGWGLRIAGDCSSEAACRSILMLVSSLRF